MGQQAKSLLSLPISFNHLCASPSKSHSVLQDLVGFIHSNIANVDSEQQTAPSRLYTYINPFCVHDINLTLSSELILL